MTAYAYLRRSSLSSDSKGGESHEVQTAAVEALAARHGDTLTPATVLQDWGISGRKGADKRPGYRALLDAIASGRCTAVYSYSLSRLGRSLPELSRLISDCATRKPQIPVRLAVDSFDTSTASGRLLANVLGSVAAFEAEVTSERVKAGYDKRRANDEHVGHTVGYGGALKAGGTVGDVQVVIDAFHEAGSYSGAARLLNDRGVPTRSALFGSETPARWWASAVGKIMDRVEPQPRREKWQGKRADYKPFVLGRLLICPTCQDRLIGNEFGRYRDGSPKRRYQCRRGSLMPHPRTMVMEGQILPLFRAEADNLHAIDRVEVATADAAALAELDAKQARILDLASDGLMTKADAAVRVAKVEAEREALTERQVILDVPPAIAWDAPPETVNRILHALWSEVRLDPETFLPVPDGFTWRVPEWRVPVTS